MEEGKAGIFGAWHCLAHYFTSDVLDLNGFFLGNTELRQNVRVTHNVGNIFCAFRMLFSLLLLW